MLFYFHEGGDIPRSDLDGVDLSDATAARAVGTQLVACLLADDPSIMWNDEGWSLTVLDEAGDQACKFSLTIEVGAPLPA